MSLSKEKLDSIVANALDRIFGRKHALKLVCKILYDFKFDKTEPVQSPTLKQIYKKYIETQISLIPKRIANDEYEKRRSKIQSLDISSVRKYLDNARSDLEKIKDESSVDGLIISICTDKGVAVISTNEPDEFDREDLKQFEILLIDPKSIEEITPYVVCNGEEIENHSGNVSPERFKILFSAFIRTLLDYIKLTVFMLLNGFKLWLILLIKPKKGFNDIFASNHPNNLKDFALFLFLLSVLTSRLISLRYYFLILVIVFILIIAFIEHIFVRYVLRGKGKIQNSVAIILISNIAIMPIVNLSIYKSRMIKAEADMGLALHGHTDSESDLNQYLVGIGEMIYVVFISGLDDIDEKDMPNLTDTQLIGLVGYMFLIIISCLYGLIIVLQGFKYFYSIGNFRAVIGTMFFFTLTQLLPLGVSLVKDFLY